MLVGALLALGGCASASVQQGALIGAGTGAVLGLGTGVLISNDHLLGSEKSTVKGDVSLDTGSTVLASTLLGAVFGGIVGAMSGKANEHDEVQAEGARAARTAPAAF